MDLLQARQWVDALWRQPENAGKEVDAEITEAAARLLVERIEEDRRVRRFSGARKIMAAAFKQDEGLRIAYVANVAMLLNDRFGLTDHETRNAAAIAVLDLIFAD